MTEYTNIKGRIHSIQSLGTVDGPGVRFVAFLLGCPLRCACCHNPDTWDRKGGTPWQAGELVERVERCRAYFGERGGVTLSGGEPLLQAEFATAVFSLCRERGIHTCLDTSGCMLSDDVRALLDVTDRVLLDIKYTSDADYRTYVGCSIEAPLTFLAVLNERSIPTTLRQVVIPGINDTEQNDEALAELVRTHPCVDSLELLPFRKICQVKYDEMGLNFPFGEIPEADATLVRARERALREKLFESK